jgi:hypothetical protein
MQMNKSVSERGHMRSVTTEIKIIIRDQHNRTSTPGWLSRNGEISRNAQPTKTESRNRKFE